MRLIFLSKSVAEQRPDSCATTRCGANAVCNELSSGTVCVCKPLYYGNPYLACHPECVLNQDCPSNKACINNHCENPCVGACGNNAQCQVVNHYPVCMCQQGFTGDPFVSCYVLQPRKYSLELLNNLSCFA